MSELLDALKELRSAGRSMQNKNFFKPVKPHNLLALEKKLRARGGEIGTIPEPIDLKKLKEKLKRMRSGAGRETLSASEVRNIPFLFFEEDGTDLVRYLFGFIDLSRFTMFRRTVFVYLLHYRLNAGENDAGEFVRSRIESALKLHAEFAGRLSYIGENPEFLLRGHEQMARRIYTSSGISEKPIQHFWETCGLPVGLYHSGFAHAAVMSLFAYMARSSIPDADTGMRAFREICVNDGYKGMAGLFEAVVGPMIRMVHAAGNLHFRKELMKIVYERLGDPDISPVKWQRVEPEAVRIFRVWRNMDTLAIFFSIISQTAQDSMWRYRRAFWSAYVDEMDHVRMILGTNAEALAKAIAKKDERFEPKNIGRLSGGGAVADKSLFMFSIKGYTFIEPSHNGKLRIWKNGKGPIPFSGGKPSYTYDWITQKNALAEFTHSWASTDSWQTKVRDWIGSNCLIWRAKSDWQI